MEDEKIVELYWQRDERALSESAEKYGARLQRISLNIVRNQPDAEECENDAYLSAWNSIPPKSPGNGLFPFLAKIVRSLSINCYRKNYAQKRFAPVTELTREMEECIPSPSDEPCKTEAAQLCREVSAFLRTLSREERNVFISRYWYAQSVREVAARYGISESKAKSMLMRTRGKLRKYFEKEGVRL